jgi:hypothetical protein
MQSKGKHISAALRIPQFKLVLGVICEEYICEAKTYVQYLECVINETIIVCVLRSVAGKRLVETEKSYCVCNGEVESV